MASQGFLQINHYHIRLSWIGVNVLQNIFVHV